MEREERACRERDVCPEVLSEFVEIRMSVELQEMLECPVHKVWPKEQGKVLRLHEASGRALNGFEALESLSDFLVEHSLQALERFCGHDRALAGTLLGNSLAEAVEGERTF